MVGESKWQNEYVNFRKKRTHLVCNYYFADHFWVVSCRYLQSKLLAIFTNITSSSHFSAWTVYWSLQNIMPTVPVSRLNSVKVNFSFFTAVLANKNKDRSVLKRTERGCMCYFKEYGFANWTQWDSVRGRRPLPS